MTKRSGTCLHFVIVHCCDSDRRIPNEKASDEAGWTSEGREVDRARRALRLQGLKVSEREDPFASIIRCTADPAKADKRTRSKWSCVMRYAAAYKSDSEPLDQFIKRKGGINACAVRFTRCGGRSKRLQQRSASK